MDRPVRVLWLVKGLGRGGAERLLVDLARALPSHEVTVEVAYILSEKDALVADLRDTGVPVTCLSDAGPWPATLRRVMATRSFDVVHTHSPVIGSVARVLAPRGTLLMHTEHNVWGRYRRATRWANAVTAGRNQVIWAVSQGVAESVKPLDVGRRRPEVRVLLHGLPPSPPSFVAPDRAAARQLLGVPPDATVVGTVGNLTEKKNHEMLIEAFTDLHVEVPGSRLVIVGDGPRRSHLTDLVRRHGLERVVTLTGVRDDVPQLLPAFDIFVMSSRYEGLSIALLEAMSAGVAPVVTAVGGMPEVVRNEMDGLVVPAGATTRLAAALVRLAENAELRTALGGAARVRSRSFGITSTAETLLDAYLRLARSQGEVLAS